MALRPISAVAGANPASRKRFDGCLSSGGTDDVADEESELGRRLDQVRFAIIDAEEEIRRHQSGPLNPEEESAASEGKLKYARVRLARFEAARAELQSQLSRKGK